MKRTLSAIAATLAALAINPNTDACTNLIVGKAASADGSVICSYNCDAYGATGSLSFYPGGRHEPGEMVEIDGWGPRTGRIPQVEYTYNVIGFMNEKQLSIVETTFDGRLELVNEEGMLDYYSMIKLGLQRAATAREAIKIMTDLVAEYGYNSSGETITVCDKEEAWIMEIIGKGPGRKGAVWVAMRVPDDCICAHANLSRIRQFPQAKKIDKKLGFYNVEGECMYSADVISFAREMGFFSGKDEDFSFRDAYCPIDFENVRYADTRVYSFFRHHCDKALMDSYLPYLNGDFDACDHLPLFIKPDSKISVRDIQDDMRDHFEGTPLDMTSDMSAGPWGTPVRPMPMTYKANGGKTYFVERPIATQKTCLTMVCQMRSWLPDAVGGVEYYNLDDAAVVAYVPVYCGVNVVPDPFSRKYSNYRVFDEKSAFWMNNFVGNMCYPRWSLMAPDLREAQKELEDYYEKDQSEVLEKASGLTKGELVDYLTAKTDEYCAMMMKRWDKLARLLIVKHNDMIMMPSENGEIAPRGSYSTPGYNQSYYDRIGVDLGDRYLMKEAIERRER